MRGRFCIEMSKSEKSLKKKKKGIKKGWGDRGVLAWLTGRGSLGYTRK